MTKQDQNSTNEPSQQSPRLSKRKTYLFRIGAVVFGLLPFAALEFSLFALGWQGSNGIEDPYIGFTAIRPLFVENEDGIFFEIAANRKPLFQPDSFLIEKPDDEFRIFCIGGSTVQGRPFSIETAFSQWLELGLTASDDSRSWKVINCGGVSYASYRLAPVLDEILRYKPDLIVLYTGHNEFLEDRTYDAIKNDLPWLAHIHEHLSNFRSYTFLRSQFVSPARQSTKEELQPEVQARLDFKGGLDQYTRDDSWQEKVVADFERNLRRMADVSRTANVPLILVNPVCNLRDVAPFKSENSPGMTANECRAFAAQLSSITTTHEPTSIDAKLASLQPLATFNPRHADLQFELGQAYLLSGDFENAKQHLIAAKDQDICPLRATEAIYKAIKNVRHEFALPLVDAMEFFSTQTDDGIPGRESLVDHVHPTIRGHQQIADLIIDEMRSQKIIAFKIDRPATNDLYRQHLESLDHFYFERAKDRLNGLQRWTEGKVRRVRDDGPIDKND